ncbi:MAG: insulinase family protein, partial [Sphingomonadales bacterium]|nr:insulinase family protein [Sphingomonadales bacterium]
MRNQLLASLAYAAKSPDKVASKAWSAKAFAGHPYGRPSEGTSESLLKISGLDLEAYRKRVFARDTLRVVAVGDIDGATLGTLLDKVFGTLPAES